jgi:CHAT domain-containing protein/tetratricopeptide (TPR) repeat protein
LQRSYLAVLLLAGWLPTVPAVPGQPEETGDVLLAGSPRESSMKAEERHTYRIEVAAAPVLVTVDQQSVDLVLEVRGPAGQEIQTGLTGFRWGPEVVLLAGAGTYRIEVRPKETSIWPGHYSVGVEALAEPSTAGSARLKALELMGRASQEAFPETPEARRQAAASYREAVAAWRQLADRRWEAEALSCLALLEQRSNDLRPAVEDYERALALWRQLGEPRREAATLNELGRALLTTGEIQEARQALEGSVALWTSLAERFDAAEARSNVCYLEQKVGDLAKALACYEEPRAVFAESGVQSEETRMVNNLGGISELLGEPDAALASYRRALDLYRALGDPVGEARSLNNVALIQRTLGEWQEALRLYGQAREIVERIGERSLKASVLTNIGFTYNSLGEPQRALVYVEEALRLRRETGDRGGEVSALNNLGFISGRRGDLKKALDLHRQALKLAVALGDARIAASTRLGLGNVLIENGEPAEALRELAAALGPLREAGLRGAETQALLLQGEALTLAGRAREALPVLREVLARQRALRSRAGEAGVLHDLAAAERSLGLHQEARADAEAAVAKVEELRTGFVSPALRAAYLATQRRAYSLLIDLLMDRHAADPAGGWDRAALAVSEQARARSLLDALYASGEHGGSAIPAALREQRRSLRRRLSAKADQQLKQSGAKAEALGQEIEALLAELDRVDAEIGRADPQAAAFRQPRPIELQEIAGQLDPGTLLLEYALGEERSYLWMVGAGRLRSFRLPRRKEIEALARRAYEELSTVEAGSGRRREAAESLGTLLLGKAWNEAAHARRLVIVPDAALHVVPFGALPVPGPGREPLLAHAEVVYLPSATTLALSRQRLEHRLPASHWAAILADPVFTADDPRRSRPPAAPRRVASKNPLRGGEAGVLPPVWERLPSSRKEAERIAALAPPGQVWSALAFAANREAALSGELRSYRIVHFATHGIADTRNPELSGLVLSLVDAAGQPREGFLGLSDIYDLDLRADLVVLSGCRTALGKEVRGEGLMGLTRGFLYAGVPRVVASLWKVQDRTTAELMVRFYRAMWQGGLPPAAALREAQRQLRRDRRYRSPYSWAGFVLQGDWR